MTDLEEILFDTVLLIEDEDAHVFLISRALKPLVGTVTRVATVTEALAALQENAFDLVISDLNLPDSVGTRGIQQVIANANESPVIVLTSSRLLSDAVEAMKLGAKDFIPKEFDHSFAEVLSISLQRVQQAVALAREKQTLQREMAVLTVAIENSTDAMAIVSRQGELRYANRTFAAIVRELGGSSITLPELFTERIVKAESLKASVYARLESLGAGGHWNTELQVNDEKDVAFDFALSVISEDSNVEHDACVVWIRDISESKQRERFQRDILSTTSHDLKGPLGAIAISAELIQEMSSVEEKVHQLAIRVESASRGAINLIDEFLSARRIEEGTFILRPSVQSVHKLLETTRDDYGSLAAPKQITLILDVDENLEVMVDPMGFVRAVGNLLSNALKFTDKGGRVIMRAMAAEDEVRIEVEDNGSGMEPAEMQKVFERFGRLEKHSSVDGSGLGLFVVKSIVKAHGGQIEVVSNINEGTAFSLTFPNDPPVNERGELISLDFQ